MNDFSPQEQANISSAFGLVERQIHDGGFTYRVENDFEKVRNEIELAGKKLTPFFWTDYFDFNNQNAFCVILEKEETGLVYLCSQKMDLGTRTLDQAYIQRLKAIYSHDQKARIDPSWTCDPFREITGTIAYSGDAVTHPDLRSLGSSLRFLELSAKLSLFLTLLYWTDVKWVVGSIYEKDISRGLAWRYGGARCYAMGERWEVLPETRGPNYAMVVSSRNEILWTAKTAIAKNLSEQQERTASQ